MRYLMPRFMSLIKHFRQLEFSMLLCIDWHAPAHQASKFHTVSDSL